MCWCFDLRNQMTIKSEQKRLQMKVNCSVKMRYTVAKVIISIQMLEPIQRFFLSFTNQMDCVSPLTYNKLCLFKLCWKELVSITGWPTDQHVLHSVFTLLTFMKNFSKEQQQKPIFSDLSNVNELRLLLS